MKANQLNILYCDNHVLVVEKPSGLLTQEDQSGNISLQQLLLQWIKENNKGGIFLHCVHRLDKPVSGIVLFARSQKALKRLNQQIREKQVGKTYIAVIDGKLEKKEGSLKHYLVHRDFCAAITIRGEKDSKLSVLHYKVLKEENDHSIVEIQLETGRYHQIRCQFSHIGHPVIGDKKYKAKGLKDFPNKILLHHNKIGFEHPVTKEKIKIEIAPSFLSKDINLSNSTI